MTMNSRVKRSLVFVRELAVVCGRPGRRTAGGRLGSLTTNYQIPALSGFQKMLPNC